MSLPSCPKYRKADSRQDSVEKEELERLGIRLRYHEKRPEMADRLVFAPELAGKRIFRNIQ
jgi:hypothetical protein